MNSRVVVTAAAVVVAYSLFGVSPLDRGRSGIVPRVHAHENDDDQDCTNASLSGLFHLPPEGVQLESVEMSLVKQAMNRSGGNQTRAAELLGISRDQLRYRLKKLEGMDTEILS